MPDPQSFRDAYLKTIYHAEGVSFTLEPVQIPDVRRETSEGALFGGRPFTLITAANPRSENLSEAENLERTAGMQAELDARGLWYGLSSGSDPEGNWREDGFVLWDQRAEVGLELGRRYGQNAIVYGDLGGVSLGWCDTGALEPCRARVVG